MPTIARVLCAPTRTPPVCPLMERSRRGSGAMQSPPSLYERLGGVYNSTRHAYPAYVRSASAHLGDPALIFPCARS